MKKFLKIFLVIVVILTVICFFFIRNLAETGHGKLNTYVALNLQLNKLLNPKPSNNYSSIKGTRKYLDSQSNKSDTTIPFSNIKNTVININSYKIPVRIYTPQGKGKFPIIIYSHGGFWIAGSVNTHDSVCRKLSKNTNAIVISVNYRLAPENPFPAAVNDIYSVLQWTYKNAESINGDRNRIAIAGDSSGGNLSAAVSLMARDKNGPPIACEALIYPPTNIYKLNSNSWSYYANSAKLSIQDMEKYISLYVPRKEDRKNPYASPLLAKDFRKLPDTLIIVAEIDPLHGEDIAYANKLKNAGIKVKVNVYKGVPHGFITMSKITNKSNEALNDICSYIRKEFQISKYR
ncbi:MULTISPECIES: alpha/beta hydrolase [Clostridium]|uniref:alpha/beta hydrolase n=1 Tax=Clostridium TaxID=1485 RepID=UPI00069CFAB6|nr:alpha/beta hydrolase [Clostridium sp. DMHC 10]KOF57693.1 esterase [Clostridium sp. DMHC 10]MCD2346625.1 alpha/beta hydrolase [Clostridium guangxiense]